MKKILSIILLPLLLGVGLPLQASWQILDNFEDGDISDWNIDDSDPDINPAAAPSATVVDDPFGLGQGKVLSVTPGAAQVANVNFRVSKDIPASMQIADRIGKSSTLYFKVGRPLVSGVPGALDITWGLTAVDPPVAYGDYSLLGRYEANGVMDIRDGGSYVNLNNEVALQTNTYYEVWFVIRHDLNTFDQYIRGGTDFPEQTKIYSGAGYRRETFDNLVNFFLQTSAGNTVDGPKGIDPAYFDDIWVDPVSVNLSTPNGWQLLDDFSDGDISDWRIDASDPDINPAAAPTASVVDDPFGAGQGKVLSVTPGAAQVANVNFRVSKDIPASMQIADQIGQSSTLYFKVGRPLVSGVPGALDITWGLTAVDPPVAYGDYSLLGRYEANGVMDIRDGGSYINLNNEVALQTDTYYEVWFVIRHDLNTFDQYIRGGTDFPEQTLIFEGAGYRRETFDNLINFFLQTSAGNTVDGPKGIDPAYFDDIFIDVTSANLSSPVPTGWRKVDDFEDGDLSDWFIDDSDPDINPAAAPTATVVDDPFGGDQGKVLSVTPGAAQVANVNFRVSKNIPVELQIADKIGQYSTLYFKVGRPLVSGVPGALDITWGLTAVDPPVAYGDYSLLGRYEANGVMDIRDGGSYINLNNEVALQTDTFYEVWFVIRHDLNTFDQYIKGGTDFPDQTLLFEGAGYRRETFDNLVNFFLQTSAGNTVDGPKGIDPAYFDDIFIDTGGINLSSPGEDETAVSTDVFGGVDIPGFPGWKASPWYKNYNVVSLPWIYHDEHGWQFVDSGSTVDVTFLFDLGLNDWIFVNEAAYRWIFLFGPNQGWIFTFGDNTPDRRFFQRLDDGSLFSVPAGLPTN